MPVNQNIFLHEADRTALQALQAIPGFSQLMKGYMKEWNEKLLYINNMASNIRISEEQLPQYHQMLKPICEKLGIETPDLFLELNVVPNAYTYGDTKPFIVLTSGLIAALPEELIPTVLAHECGHIACHHVLYRTMGTMILTGALSLIPLKNIALAPLNAAFAYWMRCSEFSADRAAILCDGSADRMIDVCARFAGFDKNIPYDINMDAFMAQAEEYEKLMKDDSMNKTMEFMLYMNRSHPINAVRAYEARKWTQTDDFTKALEYFRLWKDDAVPAYISLPLNAKSAAGKDADEVREILTKEGFRNVTFTRSTEKALFGKKNAVTDLTVNGSHDVKEGDWLKPDDRVEVTYWLPLTDEEQEALHPGEIRMPHSIDYYLGENAVNVVGSLKEKGFTNILVQESFSSEGRKGMVLRMRIGGRTDVQKGEWIPKNAEIRITYRPR